jgi:WD40 repeat protein
LIIISEDANLRVYAVTRSAPQRGQAGLLRDLYRERISGIKRVLKKSTYNIRCLAMDYTNTNVAVGDGKCIWFYNLTSNNTSQLQGHDDEITAIKFFPNESTKFVTGSKDNSVRIWDQGEHDHESHMLILDVGNEWRETVDSIRTVDVNSSGNAIACGCINGYVFVWGKQNDQEWKVEARINAYNWVNSLNFLPKSVKENSTLIIHTRPHKTAQKPRDDRLKNGYSAMWDYKVGVCLRTLVQPKHAVESSCIFQQERNRLKLLTGSWSDEDKHYIILWDLDKNMKAQLSDHNVSVM